MVGNACHQRSLGPHDEHLDAVVNDEAFHLGKVFRVEFYVLAHLCRTGVARGDIKLTAALALRYLCGYSVFATASSK